MLATPSWNSCFQSTPELGKTSILAKLQATNIRGSSSAYDKSSSSMPPKKTDANVNKEESNCNTKLTSLATSKVACSKNAYHSMKTYLYLILVCDIVNGSILKPLRRFDSWKRSLNFKLGPFRGPKAKAWECQDFSDIPRQPRLRTSMSTTTWRQSGIMTALKRLQKTAKPFTRTTTLHGKTDITGIFNSLQAFGVVMS